MTRPAPVGLRLHQLEVRGRNEFHLGPLNAEIAPGSFVGLLGPAQSGKSLLLASLCDLVPHVGEKSFLTSHHSPEVNIQLIFQEGGLLEEQSVRNNLSLAQGAFGPVDVQVQNTLLNRLGVGQAASLLPRELSGGMHKRVLLARALLCEPQILLVDNVAAGLDPDNAKKLIDLVLELKQELGFTLVWVTHEPATLLPHLDQVLLLHEGQLTFSGQREALHQNEHLQPYLQA